MHFTFPASSTAETNSVANSSAMQYRILSDFAADLSLHHFMFSSFHLLYLAKIDVLDRTQILIISFSGIVISVR